MTASAASMTASPASLRHSLTVGLIGFLTLVDLFATQAILPSLAAEYHVTAAEIGLAANASTIGMAIAGLVVGAIGNRIERRRGIVLSLALLAIPTSLLASAPDLQVFAALRIVQGLCMASAFTLTLTYLGERCSGGDTARALAAYVTGGVASNLLGRLAAATVTGFAGADANFYLLACLNVAGAGLAAFALSYTPPMAPMGEAPRNFAATVRLHLGDPRLLRVFAIGFLILFAFIGVFTYVNFVLARPPVALSMMSLGFVYFVFLPSMLTTPAAGGIASRVGAPRAVGWSLALAIAGMAMLLAPSLPAILAGLTIVGVGTFFAQAAATGYVGRTAREGRAVASGLYLSSYYLGGLAGAAAIGPLFDRIGWPAAVAGVSAALALAVALAPGLRETR